jgi:hypothetical protein
LPEDLPIDRKRKQLSEGCGIYVRRSENRLLEILTRSRQIVMPSQHTRVGLSFDDANIQTEADSKQKFREWLKDSG